MTRLSSDIVSLEAYFADLVEKDPEINTYVLEIGNNPFEMERFDAEAKTDAFSYPAMAMLMPMISGDDNGMHDFEARQDLAFAFLYTTDDTVASKIEKYKLAQLAAWRFIKYLRRDSKAGMFRIEKLSYKIAPFEYGSDNCVGQYVIITIITNTNSQIGV
ncbi:hypothetical protein [Dyadobacter diqingensis]|uniref:hypothetical protein n=1 Tax=Dyadobacter diqingensis TaxID=2938121 RepID=UPI0020C3D76D|nr:hypothetical protein [Dyadobacter diqingensis]